MILYLIANTKSEESSQKFKERSEPIGRTDYEDIIEEEDIEINTRTNKISIVNTIDSLDLTGIVDIEMYRFSYSKFYFLALPLWIGTLGILPFFSIYLISIRLFLYYTKIQNNVSALFPKIICFTTEAIQV